MDKGAKDKLVGSPGENGVGQDAQNDLHGRTGREKTRRTAQERMERRKRSSSAGSEKMERVGDRQDKMEGHCSTGQNPQWLQCQWKKKQQQFSPSQLPKKKKYLFKLIYEKKLKFKALFYCTGLNKCICILLHNGTPIGSIDFNSSFPLKIVITFRVKIQQQRQKFFPH